MSVSLVRKYRNFVYVLPKEVSTICRKKKTFLKCEDLRGSWDLKIMITPQFQSTCLSLTCNIIDRCEVTQQFTAKEF